MESRSIAALWDGLLNPIFKREVLTRLRTPWMIWMGGLYLIAPFIAIAWSWPSEQVYYGGSDEADAIVAVFFGCQAVLIALVGPAFGAFAINSEKQNRTYDFLFITLLRPWTIGTFKLAAIFCVGLILLLPSSAVLAFVFYLGGVDPATLSEMAVGIVAEGLVVGTVPLFWSAIFRNGLVSLVFSYVSLGLLPTCSWIVFVNTGGPRWLFLTASNPNTLLFSVATGALTIAVFVSLFMLFLTILLTRRPPEQSVSRRPKLIQSPEQLRQRRARWPYYLIDPARRPDPIADGINPIVAKEKLTNPMFRPAWRWRVFYIFLALLLLTFCGVCGYGHWPGGYYDPWSALLRGGVTGLGFVMLVLTGAWTVLVHAVVFTGEHEQRTIEMLKLSGLSGRDFLLGKWKICWQLRLPLVALTLIYVLALPWLVVKYGGPLWFNMAHPILLESFLPAIAVVLIIELSAMATTWVALFTKRVVTTLFWSLLLIAALAFLPGFGFEKLWRFWNGFASMPFCPMEYHSARANAPGSMTVSVISCVTVAAILPFLIAHRVRRLWVREA